MSLFVFILVEALDHQPMRVPLLSLATNVFLLQDVFLPRNIFNGPFWSIAVEWRIYFLFPLMVWGAARWGWAAVLGGAALLGGGLTLAMFRWHPEMILACPWYLLLFTIGAWAGYQSESEQDGFFASCRTWAALAVLSALCLSWLLWKHPVTAQGGADFGLNMPMIDSVAGMLTGTSLFLMSRASSAPLLSWRPLAFLGTFAYSLYLTHMPALTLLRTGLNLWLPGISALAKVALTGMCLPLVIGLAYLFFLTCERPFLRRRPTDQAAFSLPATA